MATGPNNVYIAADVFTFSINFVIVRLKILDRAGTKRQST